MGHNAAQSPRLHQITTFPCLFTDNLTTPAPPPHADITRTENSGNIAETASAPLLCGGSLHYVLSLTITSTPQYPGTGDQEAQTPPQPDASPDGTRTSTDPTPLLLGSAIAFVTYLPPTTNTQPSRTLTLTLTPPSFHLDTIRLEIRRNRSEAYQPLRLECTPFVAR